MNTECPVYVLLAIKNEIRQAFNEFKEKLLKYICMYIYIYIHIYGGLHSGER